MNLISSLEKRFGSWAIPNITLYLLLVQVVGIVLLRGGYSAAEDLLLSGGLVLAGQGSRLLSFMMIPPTLSPIFLIFAFYIFYRMGTALEEQWGTFRYNLYILLGYLFTIIAAFIVPSAYISNSFFLGGVFLAFATLFPNFELLILFILPVKVKWLGFLTAGLYGLALLTADLGTRLCVIAAFANYLIFFGKDLLSRVKASQRRQGFVAERASTAEQALHVCSECGVSDKSDETMTFRYCSTCGKCFCETHIGNHDHSKVETLDK
jgi:hypothetical protein